MSRAYTRLSAALALIAMGCGGGGEPTGNGDGDGNGGPHFTISLTASPTQVTLPVGGTVTVALSLTRGGGYGGGVTFSAVGVPGYVEATFDPAQVGGTASQSTLTLKAQDVATAGTYSITILASGDSVATAQATLTCTVQMVPGFSIGAGGTLMVARGSSSTLGLTVTRTGGFSGSVTLSLEGAPADVTAAFDPNPATGSQSTLTINAGANAPTGSHSLTIRGKATGLADRTAAVTLEINDSGGFTLSIAPTSVSLAAPGTATATITITRVGGFTGAVQLFSEMHPPGVTPSFSQSPTTGTTVTLTLTAAAGTAAGTYAMSIRGEATGQPVRRVDLSLTVTATAGFTLGPTSASVTALAGGGAQLVTFTITRTGGFAGAVSFAITGLPPGFTTTFNPASTTGTQSSLSVTVAAGVTPQSYSGTVTASAAGMPDRTATVSVTVVASGTSITWRFCGSVPAPVFFAFADGSAPSAAVAAGGDGSYTTLVASGRGVVTFTLPEFTPPESDRVSSGTGRSLARLAGTPVTANATSGYTTYVYFGSTSELQEIAAAQCPPAVATKTVFGTVAGIPANQGYGVFMGTSLTYSMQNTPANFTLSNVLDGNRDLVAARLTFQPTAEDDFSVTPDKFIVRRGLNPAPGSTLPVLDFSAAEAVDAVPAPLTLTGTDGAAFETRTMFSTANGSTAFMSLDEHTAATARTWHGLPASRLIAGDLHSIWADDSWGRTVARFVRDVGPQTLAFGPTMAPPNVSVFALTPVVRMRAVVNVGAATTQYGGMLEAIFMQAGLQRAYVMHFSKSTLASGSNYELRTPILTSLTGWNESLYGLQAGSLLEWSLTSYSEWMLVPADGAVLRMLQVGGQITP